MEDADLRAGRACGVGWTTLRALSDAGAGGGGRGLGAVVRSTISKRSVSSPYSSGMVVVLCVCVWDQTVKMHVLQKHMRA
jgi:hypothetical protein